MISWKRRRWGWICSGLSACLLAGASAFADNRTYDGTGNNLADLSWGAAGTNLLRKSAVGYADGISTPRGATGVALPNPRFVSNTVVKQELMMPNSHQMTSWVFQWGQFIDHDLDLTDLAVPTEPFNIAIPLGDSMFDPGSTGTQVMQFQRSKYDTTIGAGQPRQQINEITAYLDGSQVYGSSASRALALRTLSDGKMKTSAGNMLPFNVDLLPNATGGPVPDSLKQQFYLAGDVRANEQVGLTAAHTLFVREHNRLAESLAPAFSSISDPVARDEAIYQRARKIVGAEIQSITYNEFLPALLGTSAPGLASTYDPGLNASITTEFSTALFRVGHTMLPLELMRMQDDGSIADGGNMSLRDSFFKMASLSGANELDYLLKGLAAEQQQEVDMHMVDDVRNFLFGGSIPGGFDLASLNIQRGRDHGLPGYNAVRVGYGLPERATFAEICSDPVIQAGLAMLYGDPDNVDPWVGALSEDPMPGASVGELIMAGLVDQFTRLRDGDRFWFLNDPDLSANEKEMLMSRRLSDVILENTLITHLQASVFFMPVPEPTTAILFLTALITATTMSPRRRYHVEP